MAVIIFIQMDKNVFILTAKSPRKPRKPSETMECYLKAKTLFFTLFFTFYKTLYGYLTISRMRNSNGFEARLNQGCVKADRDRLGASLQNLDFAGRESG